MEYYGALLHGENFLIHQKSKKKMMGFYSNRFVTSSDPKEAELKAILLIKEDKKLIKRVKNKFWHKQATLFMDKIHELNQLDMKN